ncbi:MAG: ABC transporter substrate-binding protein [Clostridiales bacterium]|nr:ABC transporter substrate-binding protein [Clostridiales bacterium]
MKKAIGSLIALLTAGSMLLTGCSGGSASASSSSTETKAAQTAAAESGDKTLKVAVGCSLTGSGAKAGQGFKTATEMALEDIDYKIGDYTIVPIYFDLTDDPEKGALAYEQAIVKDGAQMAMQGWFTTIAMSCMDVSAKYQIPYLFNYGAGQSLDEKWLEDPEYYSYYVGKTYPTSDFISEEYRDLIVGAFESGKLTGEKKLAIYGEDSDWGRSIGQYCNQAFSESGFEVVYEEYFAAGTTDFYGILSKIKESGATVVCGAPNTIASAAAFLKQAKEVELDATIIAHGLNEYPEWKELCGDAAEGAITQMQVYADPEAGAEFEKRFAEKAGYEGGIGCEGVAYDCAKCTFAALQACYDKYGVLDTETIYKFATEDIQTGNWAFEDSITQASYRWEEGRLSPVVGPEAFYNPLAQVQNGEFKLIFPESSAEAEVNF